MTKLTLIQGDCLKVLPTLPDESVDLILTDPPFNLGIDYGDAYDDNKERCEYIQFVKSFVKECNTKLKNDGWFLCFCLSKDLFVFNDIMNESGLKTQRPLIWYKPNANGFEMYEPCLIASRIEKKYPKSFSTVLKIPNLQKRSKEFVDHRCQRPIKLYDKIIANFGVKNGMVLDCFLGSGTTMEASLMNKMNCTGIEINPEYIDICKERLNWDSSLGDVEFEFKDMSSISHLTEAEGVLR